MHIFDARRGKWQTLHKLGRDPKTVNNPEIVAGEYRRLRDLLVFPGARKVHVAWELSASFINEEEHNFTEVLLIRTDPINQQLFWGEYKKAVDTGGLYDRSPRMNLIEMILENDPKAEIAFVTHREMERLGPDAWKKLRPADELMRMMAEEAVRSTVPLGIMAGSDALVDVFLKARESFGG